VHDISTMVAVVRKDVRVSVLNRGKDCIFPHRRYLVVVGHVLVVVVSGCAVNGAHYVISWIVNETREPADKSYQFSKLSTQNVLLYF